MNESCWMKTVAISVAFLTTLSGIALGGVSDCACPQITFASLLDELSDPDANTYLDQIPWRGRLWSSYDRTQGNDDKSHYLRDETNADGRVEHVMMDAKGPGALVRFWTANGRDAYLRFYFDGAATPLFEGVGTNLIGGHVICPAPLADALSSQAPLEHRAQNLYLPLPYAKSLKITVETPNKDKRFWYNAEVREYAAGTTVETVSAAVLKRAQGRIADACTRLLSDGAEGCVTNEFSGTVLELKGPATIRAFALEATSGDARTIRVKMSFDGQETVDVSLAQFMGLKGTALSMPFRRTCRIETSATVSGCVATAPYRWDPARSLYFHAKGLDFPKLPTWKGAVDHYDVNWLEVTGRGRLFGNSLVVGNDYLPPEKKGTWWGEGDEKIWVDGEEFPSYFGTGTEDFFGYAWGEATPYDHPLLKMPVSDRNIFRLRRLDSVPFNRSLKLDVEIWHNHTEPTVLDYAPATFWYAEPEACAAHADPVYATIESAVFCARTECERLSTGLTNVVSMLGYRSLVEVRGGTNIWTKAIQKALDEHEVVVIPASEEPYYLDATLVVPSNRRIEATGARIRLADGVRTILLRNANVKDGTLAPIPSGTRDDSITIVGGSWEDWQIVRAGYGRSGTFHADRRGEKGDFYGVSTLFLFENCNHVTVRDATFANCGGFAVQAGGGDALVFERIRFADCYADGLHLNGNLSRVLCRDVRGKVGDDLVALNAYDWYNSSIDFGPQRFVLCEDLELVLKDGKGYPAIRIQPAKYRFADGSVVDCSISDVIFRRVKGIRTFKMYLQTPQYVVGWNDREWAEVGSGGNFYFERLDVDLTGPIDCLGPYASSDPLRGHFGVFELGANLSSVTIRDSDITFHADRWPMTHLATVGPKSAPYVTKRGNRMEIFDPYVSCTVGTVKVENVRFRGKVPDELVHSVEFKDVNGDGDSSGVGRIERLGL